MFILSTVPWMVVTRFLFFRVRFLVVVHLLTSGKLPVSSLASDSNSNPVTLSNYEINSSLNLEILNGNGNEKWNRKGWEREEVMWMQVFNTVTRPLIAQVVGFRTFADGSVLKIIKSQLWRFWFLLAQVTYLLNPIRLSLSIFTCLWKENFSFASTYRRVFKFVYLC